jgi:hypothetical protein
MEKRKPWKKKPAHKKSDLTDYQTRKIRPRNPQGHDSQRSFRSEICADAATKSGSNMPGSFIALGAPSKGNSC